MHWDPHVALTVYQPVDFYTLAAENAEKDVDNIKKEYQKAQKSLFQYSPDKANIDYLKVYFSDVHESRLRENVEKIQDIQKKIKELAAQLPKMMQGFEGKLEGKVNFLTDKIARLSINCIIYLEQYHHYLSELSLSKD